MSHVDAAIINNVVENSSRASRSYYSCRPCRFISTISTAWSPESFYVVARNSSSTRAPTFTDKYVLGQKLGAGSYSTVKEGLHKEQKTSYAVKIVYKANLSQEDKSALKNEVEILNSLNHPNIVRLYSVYREQRYYYLVMEYLRGGELFDRILNRTRYSPKDTKALSKTLLAAIQYCHDRRIAHRDLKPENLLLVSKEDHVTIKIADFGFAKRVPENTGLKTRCGSPNYVSPEIISRIPYGTQVDMWSIGVILYILLSGELPFADPNRVQLYRKIRMVRYSFSRDIWNSVEDAPKDLISKLLVRDPHERFTAQMALEHEWLTEDNGNSPTKLLTQGEKHLSNSTLATAQSSLHPTIPEEDYDKSNSSLMSLAHHRETKSLGGMNTGKGSHILHPLHIEPLIPKQ